MCASTKWIGGTKGNLPSRSGYGLGHVQFLGWIDSFEVVGANHE
jgi:hypothetical protein